jgi:transposase-like protein
MGKPIHEPYAPEFRARAGGLSKAQVARDLGINPETLRLCVSNGAKIPENSGLKFPTQSTLPAIKGWEMERCLRWWIGAQRTPRFGSCIGKG